MLIFTSNVFHKHSTHIYCQNSHSFFQSASWFVISNTYVLFFIFGGIYLAVTSCRSSSPTFTLYSCSKFHILPIPIPLSCCHKHQVHTSLCKPLHCLYSLKSSDSQWLGTDLPGTRALHKKTWPVSTFSLFAVLFTLTFPSEQGFTVHTMNSQAKVWMRRFDMSVSSHVL